MGVKMFSRGQKVVITESSANKHKHPVKGDVGYIDNMFLFPFDNFILITIFLCIHGKNGSIHIERKKFIIDIGMTQKLRNKISKFGINKSFFFKKTSINLTPSFFRRRNVQQNNGVTNVICSFPQLIGTYGVWTWYTKLNNIDKGEVDSLLRIPYGQIACFSKVGNRSSINTTELIAWVRSVLPNVVTMIALFGKYYPLLNGSLPEYINNLWYDIVDIFTSVPRADSVPYLQINSAKLENTHNKAMLINSVTKLNAMWNTALYRCIGALLNSADNSERKIAQITVRFGLLNYDNEKLLTSHLALPGNNTESVCRFAVKCLYRALFVQHNTKLHINTIKSYLPKKWDLNKLIAKADKIKHDADTNSAALNRINDLLKMKDNICTIQHNDLDFIDQPSDHNFFQLPTFEILKTY